MSHYIVLAVIKRKSVINGFYYILLAGYRNDAIIIVNGPSPRTKMIKIVFECKKINDLLLFVL